MGQSNSGAGGDKNRGKVQKIMSGLGTSTKQQQSGAPQFPYAQVGSGGEQKYKRRMAGEKPKEKATVSSAPAVDPNTQKTIASAFNSSAPQTGPTAPPQAQTSTTTPTPGAPSSTDAYSKLQEARRAAHEAKQQVRATRSDARGAMSGSEMDQTYQKFQQAREARRGAVQARNTARGAYNAAVTATQSTTTPPR